MAFKPRKKMTRPEQMLQIAIFNQLIPLMIYQDYKQFMAFHIPNGGKRTKFEAIIFKQMGVMAGVADILLMFPQKLPCPDDLFGAPPRVIFIELKAGANGGQTESQKKFMERSVDMGFRYLLLECKDAREAVDKIFNILKENGVKIK